MIKRDENGDNPQIHCDVCDRPAPPVEEIMAASGLNRMGWNCSGGVHYCPDHAEIK
jgi:hypothetical protein